MRELIHAQIGECGNRIGTSFWETITSEHGIPPYSLATSSDIHQRLSVYYNETPSNLYIPRSLFIDLKAERMDLVRQSPLSHLFKPDNFITGYFGGSSLWPKGYITDGAELLDTILERTRKEVEACDSLQGFQICHGLGGGTGSGLGTLVISKFKEEYPSNLIEVFSVFPSLKVSNIVYESYNAVFGIQKLIENADQVIVLDNEGLYNVCFKGLNYSPPIIKDLNYLVSIAMSDITCCARFPGQSISDLQKLAVNLAPFPRQHFCTVNLAPIYIDKQKEASINDITQQLFNKESKLSSCYAGNGKCLAAIAIFRGEFCMEELSDQISSLYSTDSRMFANLIPDSIKWDIYQIPCKDFNKNAAVISNSSCVLEVFQRIYQEFSYMYKRKAFLHRYCREGMDEIEFTIAETDLNDLICEYQKYENETIGEEDE